MMKALMKTAEEEKAKMDEVAKRLEYDKAV